MLPLQEGFPLHTCRDIHTYSALTKLDGRMNVFSNFHGDLLSDLDLSCIQVESLIVALDERSGKAKVRGSTSRQDFTFLAQVLDRWMDQQLIQSHPAAAAKKEKKESQSGRCFYKNPIMLRSDYTIFQSFKMVTMSWSHTFLLNIT